MRPEARTLCVLCNRIAVLAARSAASGHKQPAKGSVRISSQSPWLDDTRTRAGGRGTAGFARLARAGELAVQVAPRPLCGPKREFVLVLSPHNGPARGARQEILLN